MKNEAKVNETRMNEAGMTGQGGPEHAGCFSFLWRRVLTIALPLFAVMTVCVSAQQVDTSSQSGITAHYLGALKTDSAPPERVSVTPLAVTASTPVPDILSFNPAEVGVSAGAAQQITASFSVSGYSGSFTPTASLHYGHDYTLGAVNCTAGGASETCNVAVTFRPSLPGARKDAIFLMDGSTRLATVLLGGVGSAPFSLLQPGAFSTSVPTNSYLYQSVADENGVVYILPNGNTPYVESVTKAGVATQLPLSNPPYFWTISIDGAGVLYLFNESTTVTTYDTVQGVQGTYPLPAEPPAAPVTDETTSWYPGAIGVDGSLYFVNQIRNNGVAYAVTPNGATSYADIFNPGVLQPFTAAVDSAGDFFVGGYEINKITPAGVQTQVNTVGASEGLAVDAADTLYATRYSPTDGVAELPASNYSTPIASFGRSSPLGMSLGSDGTLYVSNYVNLDIFDRSAETIDFGEVDAGTSSTLSTASVYNGGNQPLTISGFTLSGADFTLDPNAVNECASGTVLAPGALCEASVVFAPTHPGSFSGSITVTSNSLNVAGTVQTMQLTGITYGSYDVLTPNPLVFPSQAPGTSNTLAVTLTNQGNYYPSTIYSVATDNPAFTIAQGTCSGVAVQVGASCQLQVTFTPTLGQSYTGNATIVTYVAGTGQPSQTIILPLSGSGTNPVAPTPVIAPASGTYSSSQSVTITDATSNSTIYYTVDGSSPSTSSTKFTSAITVNSDETLKAIATAAGYNQSAIASATYTFHEAVATLTPTSLAFGNQIEGVASAAQTVTLKNTGVGTLTLSGFSITGSADFSQSNNCAGSLAAGNSCTVSIVYTPTSLGDKTATLTVNSDSIQTAPTAALTGTGIAPPAATLSPVSLDFGNRQQGSTSAALILTLSNPNSTTALNFDSIAISGAGSASFNQTSNCGATIAAGGTCSISVTFTPAAVGALSAGLSVVTRYSGFGPVSISSTLTGTGTAPPAPTFSPATLAFGNQVVGVPSTAMTITLTNTGADTLVTNAAFPTIVGTGASSITVAPNCPSNLAPAASCTLAVFFTPISAGAYSLSLQVTAYYSGSPSIKFTPTVTLTGTGITTLPPMFAPGSLTFGSQTVGTTSASQTITLTNPTAADQPISLDTFSLLTNSFQQTNNCPSMLAAGSSCQITVSFAPTSAGQITDSLNLEYIEGNEIFNLLAALSGTGVGAPPPVFTPASLTFGSQLVGTTSASRTITLTNPTAAAQPISLDTFSLLTNSFQQTNNCPYSLAAGSSCQITVSFAPTSAGQITDSLNLEYIEGNEIFNLLAALSGTGVNAPPPVFNPASLTFGSQTVGTTSASQTITLTNPAAASQPILLDNFSLLTKSFQQTNNCPYSLAAGSSCQITVSFAPNSVGLIADTLNLEYIEGNEVYNLLAALSGIGLSNNPSQPTVTPGSLAFGNQPLGSTSAAQTVTLTNPAGSGQSITLGNFVFASNNSSFTQTSNCLSVMAPGTSCPIQITFTPNSAGAISDSFSVGYLAGKNVTFLYVSVTGTGVHPPRPILSPTSLTFGPQGLETTSASQTVTVTNPAGADQPVIIQFFAFAEGTHSFTQTNNCPATLAAGSSCQVEVSFVPGSAGAIYDLLLLNYLEEGGMTDAAGLSLTGTGIPPAALLSPGSLSFTSTVGTTSAAQIATLTNAGPVPLVVLGMSVEGANPNAYSQTNNCGFLLAAGASCSISVTFTPAFAGDYPATLVVSDDDPTSPQSISLTGSGSRLPDFVVASPTPPQSVPAGATVEFFLTVTAQNGAMIPPVTLTASGLPPGATATFSHSTVTPGSTSATSSITIQTAPTAAAANRFAWPMAGPALAFLGWFFLPGKRRRRMAGLGVLLLGALGALGALTMSGCGASLTQGSSASKKYVITITATIGQVQQTATVQLTIN